MTWRSFGKNQVVETVVAGRYRVLRQLAVGGMSELWAAHDLELDRPVALKLLGRDADRERFEREAQAAAGLSHPNICRLYDYGETEGRPYIVLELLDEGNLEDRLAQSRPLADPEVARIAEELASALGYAHSQGVVHRDVKPTNVLFDQDGRAKLADFGIARISGASTLTEAGTVLGTAGYISPEQARGAAVGPPADVYAVGVILYRMLTGQLPFEADNPLDLAAMHATQEPRPIASRRPDAPPELERVAMRALAKQPEDRPADGNALLAELRHVEDETLIIAPPVRRVRPRHAAAAAGFGVLALAGAGLALLAAPEASRAPVTNTKLEETRRSGTAGGGPTTTARSTPTTGTTATTSGGRTTRSSGRSTSTSSTVPTSTPTATTAPATTETQPTTETTATVPPGITTITVPTTIP